MAVGVWLDALEVVVTRPDCGLGAIVALVHTIDRGHFVNVARANHERVTLAAMQIDTVRIRLLRIALGAPSKMIIDGSV